MIINPSPPSAEDSRKSFDVGSMTSIRRKSTRIICHRIWIANETWHHYKDWGENHPLKFKNDCMKPLGLSFSFFLHGRKAFWRKIDERNMQHIFSNSIHSEPSNEFVHGSVLWKREASGALREACDVDKWFFSSTYFLWNGRCEDAWEAYGKQRTGLAGKVRQSFQYFPR